MWCKSFQTTVKGVSAGQLFQVISTVSEWNSWDSDIEFTQITGKPEVGKDFFLKPRGGPKTRLTITQMQYPAVFADISHLPLAKMHTIHTFTEVNNEVLVNVEIKITGILSFLWAKIIGEKQIEGGPAQTSRMADRAKQYEQKKVTL